MQQYEIFSSPFETRKVLFFRPNPRLKELKERNEVAVRELGRDSPSDFEKSIPESIDLILEEHSEGKNDVLTVQNSANSQITVHKGKIVKYSMRENSRLLSSDRLKLVQDIKKFSVSEQKKWEVVAGNSVVTTNQVGHCMVNVKGVITGS